ncbi:MAG: carboxymuconolactone decarboxylase family protein [Candidatus Scalinduaceae bacterium]
MARIRALDKNDVSDEVRIIFAEIESAFGMVPNLFKTSAHFPPLLKANWDKVKAVMMGGNLSRKVKETIAVLVSKDNSCQYCVGAHSMSLKAIGVTDKTLEHIHNMDVAEAGFSEKEITLILFAQKANNNPNRIPESDFQKLINLGATEPEIVEALGVMELFTAFNKFIDSLEVALDF